MRLQTRKVFLDLHELAGHLEVSQKVEFFMETFASREIVSMGFGRMCDIDDSLDFFVGVNFLIENFRAF